MCGGKGIGSPYSITERRVPELIPVLGSQPAGDVSHKPGVDSFTERSNKNNPFGFGHHASVTAAALAASQSTRCVQDHGASTSVARRSG